MNRDTNNNRIDSIQCGEFLRVNPGHDDKCISLHLDPED